MSKIIEMYDEETQEKVDNIPYLKLLYRDGQAVGSIIKHESVAGTMFVVTGYTLEPCFEGSSNNYSREYGYETEWSDNPSEVLAAYSESLDKAIEDMGATDELEKTYIEFAKWEDRLSKGIACYVSDKPIDLGNLSRLVVANVIELNELSNYPYTCLHDVFYKYAIPVDESIRNKDD